MLSLRVDDWDLFEVDMPSLTSAILGYLFRYPKGMIVTRMDCSSR